ncbi:MAG: thioredoxin family protein [Phycisphaerales bacterium]|nr:thioredoxin family protein [Phycisphaerales bacterium]
MDAKFLQRKFEQAAIYRNYVATGTDEQQRRWHQVYDVASLTPGQSKLAESFVRQMHILIVSGVWCGDCVLQVPLIQKIAEANPDKIHCRILDRDLHRDLSAGLKICGGDRVPVVLLLAEDFELCAITGDRTLSRYRAMAAQQLGPACPLILTPPSEDELRVTLQDWLNEIERVHLMLRLSGRLRVKHGD